MSCRRGLPVIVVLSLVWAHSSSATAQISNVKPTAGETIRPPLVIVVQQSSTLPTLTARQAVVLRDVGSPDSVYTWPVDETKSKPIRDLDGNVVHDADGKPLELTRDKKGVVSMDWSTERLSRMNPIDLSVTVNRPGALQPGVYRADIWADLNSEADAEGQRDELSRPVKLRWPVFIFVQGRSVKSIAFDDPKPRVGRPASVTINIEALGCDLGEGTFLLDGGGSEQDLQLGLHVRLNPANFKREFIDPGRVFHQDTFQAVNENWKLSAIRVSHKPQPAKSPPELSVASQKGTYPKVERHVIHVAAGDFYQPGLYRAKLDWPQADVAPTQPRMPIQATARTAVLPGIRIFPRHAAELEGIDLLVVADGGLPKQFQLTAAGPNATEVPIEVNELPASSVAGQTLPRQFYGHFKTTDSRGIWTIGWPRQDQSSKLSKQDQKTYQALEAEVGQPTAVDVCFQSGANLASPLEVFASAEPIWWPFYWWNPLKATGWEYTRPKAVEFAAHPDSLKLARLTQAGWLEVLSDGRRVPYDSATGNGPKMVIQATEPTPGPGPVWQIPEKGALVLSATVSLHPKEPLDPERHRLGMRRYVWTGVLTGQDSNNRPVARIIEIPVNVVVTTSWFYDWYLYVAVGGTILIVGAVLGLNYYRSNRRGKKGAAKKGKGVKASYAGAESAEDQYFGGSSSTPDASHPDTGFESPKPPAKSEGVSEPDAPPPPPTMPEPDARNEDPGDYFS